METRILPVDVTKIGSVTAKLTGGDVLDGLQFDFDSHSQDAQYLKAAAEKLRTSDIPVAFPTETVYGLGADATRSAAVKGIYKAKQRPSDNPLIVHFSSLSQLRSLLQGKSSSHTNGTHQNGHLEDPIPAIYRPLIERFWPGPMTIILPNPERSPLAPEVTAGLQTFGARIPRHVLASALISIAGVPVAAPSANASTKPSPTAAEHVAHDLNGRIETIIDGGPCDVGVESTVVDGLSDPPLVLRPGGLSLEQIRTCPGWENTEIGYKNVSEKGSQPRAPGMKYRHYSPKATVILFEEGRTPPTLVDLQRYAGAEARLGIIRTRTWNMNHGDIEKILTLLPYDADSQPSTDKAHTDAAGFAGMLQSLKASNWAKKEYRKHEIASKGALLSIVEVKLGPDTADIARGIFSALRDLDRQNVDAIFVEGIDDSEGDTAAAIMNRLRKAAEIHVNE
ncbi:Threonylcarbamoyl-AMP synthase [Pseudocercospora fuligena]|uniref:Threonylcarbamoyl-AMP synthase n=1 Tax=Pseudocercospora fuligena TaxID=685502 RepID=A0A8H6R754_9PEZI|nr:Threonylcarbamoyl-AMP synthase [Pseudocercospora fuligena]